MRNASAAIVPLFFAIMVLFWMIWYLGEESDYLHQTSNLTNLNHLQDKLLTAAMYNRYNLIRDYPDEYSEEDETKETRLNNKISSDTHRMMIKNKIDEE